MPVPVAYQGEPGAYSEQAAFDHFGAAAEPRGYQTFDAVFDAVMAGAQAYGVVPVENSLAGSIHRNYDLVMRHDVRLTGEVIVRVSHQLLALPGVALGDITRVYSHWQPFGQCETTLNQLLPDTERVEVYDTAGSAKMLAAEGRRDTAAIASLRAAQIYGLSVLKSAIEDDPTNFTRFVVFEPSSTRQHEGTATAPTATYKTSIIFAVKNIPGALFKAMAAFSLRDIDLAKIESRPLQGSPWDYLFYLDFTGHADDPNCRRALENLREFATILKVIGSYPKAARS